MADTKLTIFQSDGSTAAIDYRTEATNGDGRQVIVLGDPSSNNAVAGVQATDPSSNTEGLVVRDVNTSAIAGFLGSTLSVALKAGTIAVSLDPGHELGSIKGINNTIEAYIGATAGTLGVQLKPGTIAVSLDPGHELGSIKGITNTIGAYIDSTQGTLNVQLKPGTIAVSLDPGHLLGSVTANAGTGTMTVAFDPGHELGSIKGNSNTLTVFIPDTGHTLGKVDAGVGSFNVQLDPGHTLGKVEPGVGTFQVYLPDTGHEIGSIRGITNSINVYLGATAGTLNMQLKPGTIAVSLDPGSTLGKVDQGNRTSSGTQGWLVDEQGTASIFTASGTASGVSVSGNTIISPSANASFKVFAYSIQTTGAVSLTTKFTNGSGGAPTEFWRPLITASGVTGAQGANLSTGGGGKPIFSTGVSTTLSLVLDSATLVHYSVAYTKESA